MILPATGRRTQLLFIVAAGLLLWVLIGGVLIPLREESDSLDRRIATARKDLAAISELADKYVSLSANIPPEMQGEGSSAPLQGEVEKISRKVHAEKFIKRMVPSVSGGKERVETLAVSISEMPYQMYIELLQGIQETNGKMAVRRAKINTSFENRGNVNVEMELVKGF